MHALGLIDLAATFVRQAEAQVALRGKPPKDAMHGYWLTCRYRHEGWNGLLSQHRTSLQKAGASTRVRLWDNLLPVLQEILLAEPLARCVAHQATVLEEIGIEPDFAPLAQSALTAHVEARQRCLHMMVFGHGMPTDHAVRLNRIRKRSETFTDQLLASLRPLTQSDKFGFDALMTCATRNQLSTSAHSEPCRRLHTAGLSHWFVRSTSLDVDYRRADTHHNARIAKSILGLMPPELFDRFGVPLTHNIAPYLRDCDDRAPSQGQDNHGPQVQMYASPLDLIKTNRRLSPVVSPKRW